MNAPASLRRESLIERAADHYGLRPSAAPAARSQPPVPPSPAILQEEPVELTLRSEYVAPEHEELLAAEPLPFIEADAPAPVRTRAPNSIDRDGLREGGFILPDAPVTSLAEEFRIIKRQLLQAASGKTGIPEDKRQTILVCSPQPDDGKSFCAINLALSIATEKEVEVLLVDGDFNKPEILSILGIEGGAGLIDAIADSQADVERFVIRTDVERLSVLPAGRQANNVTELLASQRTRQVMDALTAGHPNRIVIFDSPPALSASPASILANKVGQVVMVVRADKTTEADLKEAVGLLSGCEHLSLMLNGVGFSATGRRFGSYYGYGQ